AAGFGLQTWWQAGKRSALAQHYGEQVVEIEDIMRHGHMLPLHDISREEKMVQERMQKISEEMKSLGEVSQGPGHYALGRGYEALEDYEKAREELEQAWAKGYREPQTAYALGLVLAELYQKRLDEVEQVDTEDLKSIELQRAKTELEEPALRYLELGR